LGSISPQYITDTFHSSLNKRKENRDAKETYKLSKIKIKAKALTSIHAVSLLKRYSSSYCCWSPLKQIGQHFTTIHNSTAHSSLNERKEKRDAKETYKLSNS
jgi:hypothetical protein